MIEIQLVINFKENNFLGRFEIKIFQFFIKIIQVFLICFADNDLKRLVRMEKPNNHTKQDNHKAKQRP